MATADSLLALLHRAVTLLDLPTDTPLRRDLDLLTQRLGSDRLRVAVFGPFNYGKSTLLNAILGEKALPIDLIPTTGAAICVRYGTELHSRITFRGGQVQEAAGTTLLKTYARLDEQRCMREDVIAVDVTCPHPWLQTGVELLDLPGTDDQEAQDRLVREQLLTADVVIQLLDGRKLMTLGEREHLRDWLLDRGIETVIFAVNFLNLMEPDDQRQVLTRMRFVAESFRAKLPPGMSNLYRIDALPALRAKLKGDAAALQVTGLPELETSLQNLILWMRDPINQEADAGVHPQAKGLTARLQALTQQVRPLIQTRIAALNEELKTATQARDAQRQQIQQKAQALIQQGFDRDMAQLRDWLAPSRLAERYEAEAVAALRAADFKTWETAILRSDWERQRQAVISWVHKASEFFGSPRPADLWCAFPGDPQAPQPQTTTQTTTGPNASATSGTGEGVGTAIATGLGWVLGGPIGAAVVGGTNYILNQLDLGMPLEVPTSSPNPSTASSELLLVRNYLGQFSQGALAALGQYETVGLGVIQQSIAPVSQGSANNSVKQQLMQLEEVLTALDFPGVTLNKGN